jgi:microcompartment protein CcmK/EutM
MLRATVTGAVWATKRVDRIPNGAFLEVEVDGGGRVLVATGSVASSWLGDGHPPIDALIIGSIDEHE